MKFKCIYGSTFIAHYLLRYLFHVCLTPLETIMRGLLPPETHHQVSLYSLYYVKYKLKLTRFQYNYFFKIPLNRWRMTPSYQQLRRLTGS